MLFGNIGDTNRFAGNAKTQFLNSSLKNSPLLGVLTPAMSLHGAFLMITPLLGLAIPEKNGNWVVGFSADQYLYTPEGSSTRKARTAPFEAAPPPPRGGGRSVPRFRYAPKDRNPWNVFVSGGVGGRGVIPTRPFDRYGIGRPDSAALAARPGGRFNSAVYNQPVADASLTACPDCDLLQRLPELELGASARCPRCDVELWRRRQDSRHVTLPLTLAAALLYVIANTSPMLGLSAVGHAAETTVFGGAEQLWRDGQEIVAVLVLFTAVVAPALQIGFMLAIILGNRRAAPPSWVGVLLRYHPTTRIWSMIEVMMLGVLVALIKIAELATVIPGVAMYALAGLVFLLAAMQSSFDPRAVWQRVEWAEDAARDAEAPAGAAGATP